MLELNIGKDHSSTHSSSMRLLRALVQYFDTGCNHNNYQGFIWGGGGKLPPPPPPPPPHKRKREGNRKGEREREMGEKGGSIYLGIMIYVSNISLELSNLSTNTTRIHYLIPHGGQLYVKMPHPLLSQIKISG